MSRARILAAALALSASAFVGIISSEGYTEAAVVPTKNDRPTVGFGSTFRDDGAPVQLGDRITPVRAVQRAAAHLSKEEAAFRASIPGVELHQAEYDLYMDWVYQYGTGAWRASTMRRQLLAGQYGAACDALLLYRKSDGYDCSTPGNRTCPGVWTRQLARHKKCMEAQ
ncbi:MULTISPECIES: glycoside hydrolase family protein [unclassified Massilia]|uniref:glycoside hydrolase family protein n=1 Tax=unclassified Massilia TaxID=2609279 RepID=UPI00178228D1|nr:glycoside hydrolase family protein [Massilia sp. CFBP 13647]MBD8673616.1 glycoside hydrolase family protein [Massilia sp. CFBP 13721]